MFCTEYHLKWLQMSSYHTSVEKHEKRAHCPRTTRCVCIMVKYKRPPRQVKGRPFLYLDSFIVIVTAILEEPILLFRFLNFHPAFWRVTLKQCNVCHTLSLFRESVWRSKEVVFEETKRMHMKPFKSFVVTVSKKLSKLCFNKEGFSKKENKDSERHCVRMKSTHGSVLHKSFSSVFCRPVHGCSGIYLWVTGRECFLDLVKHIGKGRRMLLKLSSSLD